MDKIRGSVSRLKKKVKHRLTRSKRESGATGAGAHGESVDPAGPPPPTEPPIVAGGRHDQDGSGANADGRRVRSADKPQQPDEPGSVPAHGSKNNQDGKDADGEEAEPSPPTPSIPQSGTPDRT